MKREELFYPDIEVTIGQYLFNKGIRVSMYSDKEKAIDWGKIIFTQEFKPAISNAFSKLDKVCIRLGYDGVLQDVFNGFLTQDYDAAGNLNEILFKDSMYLLENAKMSGTFVNCTPQEIIREGLRKAGITEYVLTDNIYPTKTMFPIFEKNIIQVLKQINLAWNIGNNGTFIKGIFYWGAVPEQQEILIFEYANNIISLDRNKNMWELITVSVPSMQHSQKIIINHPKISGTFEVEKVIFSTNSDGFLRTTIYFKE